MTSSVASRTLNSWIEPEAAFSALSQGRDAAFWLDASRAEPGLARYSFLGFVDANEGAVIKYRSPTRQLTIQRGGNASHSRETLFSYLSRELESHRVASDLPFDFHGGLVGYFGYELKGECGAQAPYPSQLPDAAFLSVDRWIAFDHHDQLVFLCQIEPGDSTWFDRTEQHLRAAPPASAASPPASVQFAIARNHQTYLDQIRQCQRYIVEGESYELCLTNRIDAAVEPALSPFDVYRHLRRINPAPYAAYFNFGDGFQVLSSSPERFLAIDRNGAVETKPIKGTRRRASDPVEDAALREDLRASVKDRAENLMITDLMRNDLGRVCEIGSVHVPKLMDVETYATVHQLVSTVRGRLRPGLGALDCIQAAFPGGSMTGAPKLRTMSLLDQLERAPRGVYSGAIGYLSYNGAADLSIAIRTIIATPSTTGSLFTIGTGGAIVALSDADAEFEETLVKARAQIAAVLAAATSAPPAIVDRGADRVMDGLRQS